MIAGLCSICGATETSQWYTGSKCKGCYLREHRAKTTKEVQAARAREYRKKTDYNEKQKAYLARPEVDARRFGQHLRRKFGITPEVYAEMLTAQNGVCAICFRPERRVGTRRLAVDHCHATGKVRGLLCYACNASLGHFEDDAPRLIRAAQYLKKAGN